MKYFKNINSLEELKKEYKRLAMKNHPDRGGNEEVMKMINTEYEKMFNILKDKKEKENKKDNKETCTNESAFDFISIIDKLININNINIELVGSWIWVDGNTYPIKELLKELKFQWSSGKKKWYYTKFSTNDNNKRKYKGKQQNMSTIRAKYGSTVIKEGKSSKNFVPQLT